MNTFLLIAMGLVGLFGTFWLWVGEGNIVRYPKRAPWWYKLDPWHLMPRCYDRPVGRIMAVLVGATSFALIGAGFVSAFAS